MVSEAWRVQRPYSDTTEVKKKVETLVRFAEKEEVATATTLIEDYIVDYETRKMLWRTVFGNDNLPQLEADAVDKYAGSLKKSLPSLTREEIEEAIREAKEK